MCSLCHHFDSADRWHSRDATANSAALSEGKSGSLQNMHEEARVLVMAASTQRIKDHSQRSDAVIRLVRAYSCRGSGLLLV